MFKELNRLGAFSKLQLLHMGLPSGIIKNLIKIGMLIAVEHPTKTQYRVADGILKPE